MMMDLKKYLDMTEEVASALKEGRPVVALETTIISHGMPYPQNLDSARRCEEIIRSQGAVPASMAIVKGRIKVGLSEEDLQYLATSKEIRKVSRRDFAACIADGASGASTVAATIMIADMVGIKFFATGGIGGVHRGFKDDMDVSADLEELANTKMCVVCAGAKSILDIPKTLEYLETKGVSVLSYQNDEFPAFFLRNSGSKADARIDDLAALARTMKVKEDLDIRGGIVLGNPIPGEYEMDSKKINSAIEEALQASEEKGIKGKEATPFLLKYVVEATEGKSLEANMQLVWNNCLVAARLAVLYAEMK